MKHTKGKLIAEPKLADLGSENPRCSVRTENGKVLFTVAAENGLANASHLVKCWNGHDDLTEKLADYKEGCEGLKLSVGDLRQQRDDLLAACKEAKHLITNHAEGHHRAFVQCFNNLEEAVAKAETN
jgi:hypothetical protein